MDICGYTSVSLKNKKNCMRCLGLWGNHHRKGGLMKEKGVVSGGRKKTSRGRKNVILKSFRFEVE